MLQGDFTEESGHRAGMRLAEMAPRPAAVFAANDAMAIGCLLALGERGLRVPQDMAVAGFDDIPVARLIRPSLTTVRINIAELSRRALKRLVAVIDGDDAKDTPQTVHPRLVVRESSAPRTPAATTAIE